MWLKASHYSLKQTAGKFLEATFIPRTFLWLDSAAVSSRSWTKGAMASGALGPVDHVH